MKLKIVILGFILVCNSLFAQQNQLEKGIRFLKLGNSYREAGLYDKAIKYLHEGQKISESQKSLYWSAVAQEYFGYLYIDLKMPNEAYNNLMDAYTTYVKIIRQSDGSQIPLKESIKNLTNSMMQIKAKNPENSFKGPQSDENLDMVDDDLKNDFEKNEKDKTVIYNDLNEALNNSSDVYALDLSEKGLLNLTSSISELRNLEILFLQDNELDKLPDDLGNLKNLTILDLENNNITNLPKSIYKCKNLELINLKNNPIGLKQLLELSKALPKTKIVLSDDEE